MGPAPPNNPGESPGADERPGPPAERKKRLGSVSSRHRLGATQATKKKGPGILIFIGAAVSLAIAGCCLTTSLLTPIWRNYTPPDESFTVSFPAKPEVVNKTFQTANGPVAFTSYSVKNALLGRVYGVQIY